ncbi:hypothetical protein RLOC_00008340 [Lonchura striata]|uniref:Uncharacterized protein n=1 Tax=Lonchura striata TaxID=40157 RepID=A0A218UHD6_9PASE|nr:hypothetical protein RLOC_00008340 [Lonchura striata domestica]
MEMEALGKERLPPDPRQNSRLQQDPNPREMPSMDLWPCPLLVLVLSPPRGAPGRSCRPLCCPGRVWGLRVGIWGVWPGRSCWKCNFAETSCSAPPGFWGEHVRTAGHSLAWHWEHLETPGAQLGTAGSTWEQWMDG